MSTPEYPETNCDSPIQIVESLFKTHELPDIVAAIQGRAIHTEMINEKLEEIPGTQSAIYRDPINLRVSIGQALAGSACLEALPTVIGDAEDLETYIFYLDKVVGSKKPYFDYYRLSRSDTISDWRPSKVQITMLYAAALNGMHNFADRHPEIEADILTATEEILLKWNTPHAVLNIVNRVKEEQGNARHNKRLLWIINCIQEDSRWAAGITQTYTSRQSKALEVVALETVPTRHLQVDQLSQLEDEILSDRFSPKQPIRMVTQSLNATLQFVDSLAELQAEDPSLDLRYGKQLGTIASLLKARKDEAKPVGYSNIIQLGNMATQLLNKDGAQLMPLNQKDLEDYPKAVDRLLRFALTKNDPEKPSSGNREVFAAAAACIRLIAFKGVEHKLQQRVLSIGDILMRYPELSAESQRDKIEQLHRNRSEAAIEGMYRVLRSRHKSHADRRKYDEGYGILS